MDKLEVVDLYENANKTKIDEFTNKTNSTLKVNIDKNVLFLNYVLIISLTTSPAIINPATEGTKDILPGT